MVKHCSKTISKIMDIKRIPDTIDYESIQSIVNTFDALYYRNPEVEDEIPQLDGNFDDLDKDKEATSLYGISCEIDELTAWINFLRGFNNIWTNNDNHGVCKFYPKQEPCYFCLMRSLFTRLKSRGNKGPKTLKPFEAVYLLGQMEKNGFNWKSDETSTIDLIKETIFQLSKQTKMLEENFEEINLCCNGCGTPGAILKGNIIDIDTDTLNYPASMVEIFNNCIKKKNDCSCKEDMIITEAK